MKSSDFRLGLCSIFAILLIITFSSCEPEQQNTAASSSFQSGSVYCKNRQCRFSPTVLDWSMATAVATFNSTLNVTGWGTLDIVAGRGTNVSDSNLDVMFAAGYLEGRFTARQMELNYHNLLNGLLPASKFRLRKKVAQWYIKQRQWTDMMVSQYGKTDPLWRHVSYIMAQFDGLMAGYNSVTKPTKGSLDSFAFSFLNGVGDFIDLQHVLSPETQPDWTQFTAKQASNFFNTHGHCSALIKVLPGLENIFMSHSSWFTYISTNRIFKHYDFNVNDPDTHAKRMSFSSYPGFLESLDDFYMLGSGMVMLQTTLDIFNTSSYALVYPDSLFAWQRVRVANMMANSGKEWTQIIAKYNSGTYNNEYMVIDLKKFTPQQPLVEDTLWVAEQIPGLVASEDATHILRDGYFPSYNVPYFKDVFIRSGYAAYVQKHGLDYSYDLAPRAKIFRRDQGKVTDLQSMKDIMRYNDFKNDKYSGGSPFGAICSRGDLQDNAVPDGCYDTKVTDLTMAKSFEADIINGPTLGTNLPAFTWTEKFKVWEHVGLPQTYNFGFVRTKPKFNRK